MKTNKIKTIEYNKEKEYFFINNRYKVFVDKVEDVIENEGFIPEYIDKMRTELFTSNDVNNDNVKLEYEKLRTELMNNLKNENNYMCSYVDYNDEMSDEMICNYIEGNTDIDDYDLFNYDIDAFEEEFINKYKYNENVLFDENLLDEMREYIRDNWNYDEYYKDLLKRSSMNVRVVFKSDDDIHFFNTQDLYLEDILKKDEYIQKFNSIFKGTYEKESLEKEVRNLLHDYSNFTFMLELTGEGIERFRKDLEEGYLILPRGTKFGLHNSWIGSGSLLDMELLKEVKISKDLIEWYSENSNSKRKGGYSIREVHGMVQEWYVEY